jgi:CRP-like cAMP-binding protein
MPLAELGAGEYFGEMALLTRTTRNATVRCLEPMNTLSIPKRDLGLLGTYLPGLRENLDRIAAGRRA